MLSLTLALALHAAPAVAAAPDERPKLVVIVAVDQMIPEQLARLRPYLEGGLGRFATEGVEYPEAMLGHGVSETGPGHVSLATGLHPGRHGVIGNQWLDGAGRSVYCVSDPDSRSVTSAGVGDRSDVSPRNVRAETLGDRMRAAFDGAKVVSISAKDRAAVGMGGQAPDLCLWWDKRGSGFRSSTWYGAALPDFVNEWNATWTRIYTGGEFSGGWSLDLPAGRFLRDTATRAGTRENERARDDRERAFREAIEHVDEPEARATLARYAYESAVTDSLVTEIALRAIDELDLGGDEAPDLLAVSFSACDVVGHSHGPYSDEVTDLLLRLDAHLERLFAKLDESVGAGAWTAALAADHGVMPLPSEARRRGEPAEVLPRSVVAATVEAVNRRLEGAFGAEGLVAGVDWAGLRLDRGLLAECGLDAKLVRSVAVQAVREESVWGEEGWLAGAYTSDELARGDAYPGDPLYRLQAVSFDPERSPDVDFVRRPWTLVGMDRGTTHGTPHAYDRRIAMAFVGAGVPRAPGGRSFDAAISADVVPTLLAILGLEVEPGELDGTDLFE